MREVLGLVTLLACNAPVSVSVLTYEPAPVSEDSELDIHIFYDSNKGVLKVRSKSQNPLTNLVIYENDVLATDVNCASKHRCDYNDNRLDLNLPGEKSYFAEVTDTKGNRAKSGTYHFLFQ